MKRGKILLLLFHLRGDMSKCCINLNLSLFLSFSLSLFLSLSLSTYFSLYLSYKLNIRKHYSYYIHLICKNM